MRLEIEKEALKKEIDRKFRSKKAKNRIKDIEKEIS